MRLEKKTPLGYHIVEKVWGNEVWIENNDQYCGKLLNMKQNGRTSLHFHMEKEETMYCLRGVFVIRLFDPENGDEYEIKLFTGDSLFIPRGQPHSIIGIDADNVLVEFSTTHWDSDSYRVGKPSSQ